MAKNDRPLYECVSGMIILTLYTILKLFNIC
jgi:hypothetical protein